MHVEFYAADRLYGFAETEGTSVFFHLGVFVPGRWPGLTLAPPPILGEEVQVVFDPTTAAPGKAPKATSVVRVNPPRFIQGEVESFNPVRAWGFARDADGEQYYLHRSDVEAGRLPLPGQQVSFYRGWNRDRPRACYARVG